MGETEEHTEDNLFGICEHVQGEGDFVLVIFKLEPANEGAERRD